MLHAVLRITALTLSYSLLWLLPLIGDAQQVPLVACPKYFEYLNDGSQNFGRITLPNVPMGTTRLSVRFSQQAPVNSNYYGRLSLYEDQQTTINNLERGLPISYRVDFPTDNVLPKLTLISVSGVDICVSSEYPPPSTVLDLQHTLQTSTVRGTRPLNSNVEGGTIYPVTTSTFPNQNFNRIPQQNQPATQQTQFINPNPAQNPFLTQIRPAPQSSTSEPNLQTRISQPDKDYSQCGVEGNSVTPFIYGGITLARGQFPWLAAVYRKQSSGLRFLCGGSLVSSNTVITAAHCFKLKSLSASQVVVYLGRHNLENYGEAGVVTRDIRSLLIHPDYSGKSLPDADIAIMQMQTSVSFNEFIRPICLWSESSDNSLIVGQTAFVAGWGADEKGREVSALPKMVDTAIVSDNECLRSSEVYSKLTTPRTICAGNRDGTGPCMGDSGGGLMLSRNGLWMLRGVVSAGLTSQGQCDLRQYVIYCDLAKHIAWVRSNIY
ncbi:PREDICTED: serine protease gd [Rhagoletis zephyria]|uniref:serine protease gd n=1 Tax=Rhagoletis zephyria TaxID=28612 RepID=UPI0008112BA2|nr:PREDICTED: serine protease gd [Rhagoletis zephyria]